MGHLSEDLVLMRDAVRDGEVVLKLFHLEVSAARESSDGAETG